MPVFPELLPDLTKKLSGKHIGLVRSFVFNRLHFIDLSEWDSELDITDIDGLLTQSSHASAATPRATSTPPLEKIDGNSIFA